MRLFFVVILTICGTGAYGSDRNKLVGLDGDSHALSEFVGHGYWVMVNVWSPGCPHCVDELPTLRAFHANNDIGAMVVGVAVEYPGFGYPDDAHLSAFASDNQINFPLLLADRELAAEFVSEYVDVVPITFAFHPDGRMVARWHGVITELDINEIINDFTVQRNE